MHCSKFAFGDTVKVFGIKILLQIRISRISSVNYSENHVMKPEKIAIFFRNFDKKSLKIFSENPKFLTQKNRFCAVCRQILLFLTTYTTCSALIYWVF